MEDFKNPKIKSIYLAKNREFTSEEIIKLSNIRIIQKNLVHFHEFPDEIYDPNLLKSYAYFGQYGLIKKIKLSVKKEELTKYHKNSAYITFDNKMQASYAILSVDKTKISNQIVRAFFGTTKYCIHFLNNRKCPIGGKCNFIHELVEETDVIKESEKFGHNKHISLAKKIIGYNTNQSKLYAMNINLIYKTVLPNINSIYIKEKSKEKKTILSLPDDIDKFKKKSDNFSIFRWKTKSRFFDTKIQNLKTKDNYIDTIPDNLKILIDNLGRGLSLSLIYVYLSEYINNNMNNMKSYSWDYLICKDIYDKTNDLKIKAIIDKKF